jgi:two-component system, cell cycle response regulator CpdR
MLVLLVDDDVLVLEATAGLIETLGWQVLTASSGADALAQLEGNEAIKLLVTDINMPGLNGYELAERAKRLRGDLKVIFISGWESKASGVPLLRKPLVESELARVMRAMNEAS